MQFDVAISPLVVGAEQPNAYTFLAVSAPRSLGGITLDKSIKGFILSWCETQAKNYAKTPGMEGIRPLPVWGRDYKMVKEMADSCGMERLEQIARLFWTDPTWADCPRTMAYFRACYDSLLERVAKLTRESND